MLHGETDGCARTGFAPVCRGKQLNEFYPSRLCSLSLYVALLKGERRGGRNEERSINWLQKLLERSRLFRDTDRGLSTMILESVSAFVEDASGRISVEGWIIWIRDAAQTWRVPLVY